MSTNIMNVFTVTVYNGMCVKVVLEILQLNSYTAYTRVNSSFGGHKCDYYEEARTGTAFQLKSIVSPIFE